MTSLHRLNEPNIKADSFLQLMEATPDPVCQYDATGCYLAANPTAIALLGLSPHSLRGRSPLWLSQNEGPTKSPDRELLQQIQTEVMQVRQTKEPLRAFMRFQHRLELNYTTLLTRPFSMQIEKLFKFLATDEMSLTINPLPF